MKLNFKAAFRALTDSDLTFSRFITLFRGNLDISPYDRSAISNLYKTNSEFRTLIDLYTAGFVSIPIKLETLEGETVTQNYRLDLLRAPNARQTQSEFEADYARQRKSFEEAFIYGAPQIVGTTEGRINSMRVLPSQYVDFKLNAFGEIEAYTNTVSSSVSIPAENVLHIAGSIINPDTTLHATPLVVSASMLIKKLEAIHRNDINSFNNQGVSALVAFRDNEVGLSEKKKRNSNEELNSTDNANGINVIERPVDVHQLTRTPVDLGTMTSMKETFNALALLCQIPLPLISQDASTYNNVANARVSFIKNVLVPDKELYCEKLSLFLNCQEEGLRFTVDTDKIEELKDVPIELLNAMNVAKASINDRLRALGLETIDNPVFDQPLLNLNETLGAPEPITNNDLQ